MGKKHVETPGSSSTTVCCLIFQSQSSIQQILQSGTETVFGKDGPGKNKQEPVYIKISEDASSDETTLHLASSFFYGDAAHQ